MEVYRVLVLCLGLVLIRAETLEERQDFDAKEEACIAEVGIDRNELLDIKKSLAAPEDNVKFKEFLLCDWKKHGYISEAGEIQEVNLKADIERLAQNIVREEGEATAFAVTAMDKCKNIKEDDDKETVIKTVNCVLPQFKELIVQNANKTVI